MSRKQLKRIEWKTVKRVIGVLHESTRMKKTVLATACHMGYDKCGLYLDWLEMMGLIKKETNDDGFEEIMLTERGHFLRRENLTSKIYDLRNRPIEDL